AFPSDEREPAWLGLDRTALAPAAAAARGLPARLHLLPRVPIAADAREVAARRLVRAGTLERVVERADLRLHLADLLQVLVLAERRLDALAQHVGRRARPEQQRDGSVAELELALDGLRIAVD